MTKVQEYLRKKKIQEFGLPKMYVVKSSPEGVEMPVERQVVEIIENVSFRGRARVPSDRYKLDRSDYPYEVDILRGETSREDCGYGTGVGDLWGWTYFSSISQEEAEKYYQEELARVTEKYFKQKNQETMWEYRKETIEIKDVDSKNIVDEMNKLGADGWEAFSLSEKVGQHQSYGDTVTTYYYTIYMKRKLQ